MTDDASHQESQGQVNPPLPEGMQMCRKLYKLQLSPSQSASSETGLPRVQVEEVTAYTV